MNPFIKKILLFVYVALKNLLYFLFLIALIDFAMYFLLPEKYNSIFKNYRFHDGYDINDEFINGNRFFSLEGYYTKDPSMGFDISKNIKNMDFIFSDKTVKVFSNEFGCYDTTNSSDLNIRNKFDYIAGDSFTWGHDEYKFIFPTIYESKINKTVMKCGVPHSGQIHQFLKFKTIMNNINNYPENVFVGYYSNDVSNDFFHPHSSVIDGIRYEMFDVDHNLNKIPKDFKKIKNEILNKRVKFDKPKMKKEKSKFKDLFYQYSLTYNIYKHLKKLIKRSTKKIINNKYGIYLLDSKFSYEKNYINSPYTLANRQSIEKWRDDSVENKYNLIFILIPPKESFNNKNYYKSLKVFLDEKNINYIDIAKKFNELGGHKNKYYFFYDGHINKNGHEVIASECFKKINF